MNDETVLLVHSGGFTSRQWRKLGEALSANYRVMAPDLLGYGTSGSWPDGKPFHYSLDLDYLLSMIDGPVHLVGHSYGGFLALQLAIAQPQLVRSIAAYEPVAFGMLDEMEDADARAALANVRRTWEPDANGVDEPWLAGFVDWWNGNGAWSRLPEETRAAFRGVGWKLYQEVMTLAVAETTRAMYASITVPTLVMAGAHSPLTERRVVENLAKALPNARAQFFESAGHMGPITHAPLVNAAIAEHLDRGGNRLTGP